MNRFVGAHAVCQVALLATLVLPPLRAEPPRPLTRAHAHNDYEHPRPLLDALDQGFCSVEADIHLVGGALLVAHDRSKVRPERTLEALYLEPLRERVEKNAGRVYAGGPTLTLLVDIKSDADRTWAVLNPLLQRYASILTRFTDAQITTNAVTVVLSGNRPRARLQEHSVRFAALDGRPEDLEGNAPPSLIPLISEDWKRLFQWRGRGTMPGAEQERLRDFVQKAHQAGRQVRFWGTPDAPEMWGQLLQSGVDWINADDLSGLRTYLENAAGR